jgi:uncharacterized lipoprotein YajG
MSSNHCCCRLRTALLLTRRLTVAVAVAAFAAGCAIRASELPISYVPQQNVQAIKGADAVPVEVTVEDLEPDEYDSVWDRANPFSDKLVRFQVKDPVDTVKGAAETELKARGFKIGSGGASVIIKIERFAARKLIDGEWGFTATGRGYLSMRVEVQPQTGKVPFSKNVGGEGTPTNESAFSGKPATHVLEESLADAFKRLFADPAFTAAILATRQQSPAKPVVSPGRIAGAFATMSQR